MSEELTTSMKQRPCWQLVMRQLLANQDVWFFCITKTSINVFQRAPPLKPTLIEENPFYTLTPFLFNIHFNIFFSKLFPPKYSFVLGLHTKIQCTFVFFALFLFGLHVLPIQSFLSSLWYVVKDSFINQEYSHFVIFFILYFLSLRSELSSQYVRPISVLKRRSFAPVQSNRQNYVVRFGDKGS